MSAAESRLAYGATNGGGILVFLSRKACGSGIARCISVTTARP